MATSEYDLSYGPVQPQPMSNQGLPPATLPGDMQATYGNTNLWGQNSLGVGNNGWGDFTAALGIGQDSGFLGTGGTNANGSSSLWGSGGIAGGLGSLLGGAGGIAGAVMAGKQAKLGRDIFNFKQGSYNENNRLTAQSLNRNIADRQVADIAQQGLSTYTARRGDPGAYREDNKVTPRKI